MAKHIILGNGDMTVSLDAQGQVAELFYPFVSCGNHLGGKMLRHKIGVYCEDAVHWLDDGAWRVKQMYYPGRLVSRTVADNSWLGIRLEFQDFVDSELSVLARNIQVVNLSSRERQIKLFIHQSFTINANPNIDDTAQYIPNGSIKGVAHPSIVHYCGDKAFMITGYSCQNEGGFSEFSVGHFGNIDGNYMSGVWCDAADGSLSGNASECGQTDSIIGFPLRLKAHDSCIVNYQLAAGDGVWGAGKSLRKFLHEGVSLRTRKTVEYWTSWSQPIVDTARELVAPDYRHDVVNSLMLSAANIATNGAVACSADTGNAIVQPMISALVARVMAKYGQSIEAARIYDFFITPVSNSGYLYPSYDGDGNLAINKYAWRITDGHAVPPIQIADSASLLYSLGRTILDMPADATIPADWRKRWAKLGKPLADFLSDYIDPITKLPRPSCHEWTSGAITTTSDTAFVYGSLCVAANVSERLKDTDGVIKYRTVSDDIRENAGVLWNREWGYFYYGINREGDVISYDGTLSCDGIVAAALFGLFNDETMATAQQTLEREHLCNNGTYMRYESDDKPNMSEIMAMSLTLNKLCGKDISGLLASCSKVLHERGGYKDFVSGVAANDILLETSFADACLMDSEEVRK